MQEVALLAAHAVCLSVSSAARRPHAGHTGNAPPRGTPAHSAPKHWLFLILPMSPQGYRSLSLSAASLLHSRRPDSSQLVRPSQSLSLSLCLCACECATLLSVYVYLHFPQPALTAPTTRDPSDPSSTLPIFDYPCRRRRRSASITITITSQYLFDCFINLPTTLFLTHIIQLTRCLVIIRALTIMANHRVPPLIGNLCRMTKRNN